MASASAQALDALRRSPDGPAKGTQFEHLSEGFLRAMYGATDIRPVVPDLGVDRLFTDDQGNTVAAQMKCYASGHTVKMSDVNNFITEASKHKATALVLLVTSDLSRHAAARAADYGITVHGFDDLVSVDCWTPDPVGVEPPLVMRPHQQAAFDAAMAATDARGQIIMPCRTGKSLVEAELAGVHPSSLVTVPTIALAAQMGADIRRQHPTKPMLLVYSGDELDKSTTMPIRATTDPTRVKEFRDRHAEHIIISTYHSVHLLAGQQKFDLILCDEAHRLATNTTRDNGFKVVLHDAHIPAKRRLFFTATPRVTVGSVKSRLTNMGLPVYSMDEPALFGTRLHEMTWADAVGQDLILPLNLIAPLANESSLMASITANNLTKVLQPYLGDAAKVRDVASVVGMLDAHTRYGVTTMLTFHSSIAKAHDAEQITQAVADALGIPIQTLTVTSQSPKGHVAEALAMLEPGKDVLNVVFSVQMFTEGINTPALDAVVYFEPKRSVVSIAQSLARPVTKSPDKQAAYAILPVFAQTEGDLEANIDASEWAGVKSVARALFSFGMTPEQIDVDVQALTGVAGGGNTPFTFLFAYDPGFDLETAKANIEAAVIRLDPALRSGEPCSVVMDEGTACGRPIKQNGLCAGHDQRLRTGRPMGAPWRVIESMKGRPCPVVMDDGTVCGKVVLEGGMCPGHKSRRRNGLSMGSPWREPPTDTGQPCPVAMDDGTACGEPIAYNSMCRRHNERQKKGSPPMGAPWREMPGNAGEPCPVTMDDGTPCGKPIGYNGMCPGHSRRRQTGQPMGEPWLPRGTGGQPCPITMDNGAACGKPVIAHGMCSGHDQRRRHGTPMGAPWRVVKGGLRGQPCPVVMDDGAVCGRRVKSGEMCESHQTRKRKGIPLGIPWRKWAGNIGQPCPVIMDDGTACGRPISHFGMCNGHNTRQKNGTPMGIPWLTAKGLKGKLCPVIMDDGTACGRDIRQGGMCSGHYTRQSKGKPMGSSWRVTNRRS
jgi:superfamily II DNA or RNA helicase